MNQIHFNEDSIVSRLSRLPPFARITFALCCATRQFEAYEQFVKNVTSSSPSYARTVIDQLWKMVAGDFPAEVDWDKALDEVMDLLPEEQDQWAPFHVYADHAISSLIYTIRCVLDSSAQEAAWSARRAYEAADQAAIRDLGVQTGITDSEVKIHAHFLVQRELQRQERDLQSLETGSSNIVIKELESRAFAESTLSLDEILKCEKR